MTSNFKLRGRQPQFVEKILSDLATRSRLLCIAPGGTGKTELFAFLASHMWTTHGIRTLVLENRDRLTEQTAERIRKRTGLEVDVEKGDQRASPYAPIVVMCVQSGSKVARLTGFSDTHFGLVVVDECHLCLSPSWLRVIHYFHYGASSLQDGWVKPADDTYEVKGKVVGFTASPDIGTRKNLGDLFQGPEPCINYSFLDAIEEGWLVGIKEINVPVKIDTTRFRVKRSTEGDEFSAADQTAALIPIIDELAEQIVIYGKDKKGMCFVPSVEIAKLMTASLVSKGIKAIFVSGECIDKSEKTDLFAASGPGTWLINCTIYTYGVDFPDVSAIAPFGAIISKAKYVQILYRGTRVLDGTVNDAMTAAERVAAIAASAKKFLLVISPFYISERIHICEPFDLYASMERSAKSKKAPKDLTDPAKVRDYIKQLEKAADKHAHKQPRTINPVAFSLSVGDKKLAAYKPESDADAAPPSRAELDLLLQHDISTVDVKCSGQAQALIKTLIERERLGLATPKQLQQLMLRLHWPEEKATLIKKSQAGVFIYKGIHYKEPKQEVAVEDHGDPFV